MTSHKDTGMEEAFRQAGGDPGLTAMVRGDVLKGLFTLNSAPAENLWEVELDESCDDIAGAGRLMNKLRGKRRARKDDCMLNGICLMMMFNDCPVEHHMGFAPDHDIHGIAPAHTAAIQDEPEAELPGPHIH